MTRGGTSDGKKNALVRAPAFRELREPRSTRAPGQIGSPCMARRLRGALPGSAIPDKLVAVSLLVESRRRTEDPARVRQPLWREKKPTQPASMPLEPTHAARAGGAARAGSFPPFDEVTRAQTYSFLFAKSKGAEGRFSPSLRVIALNARARLRAGEARTALRGT